MPINTELVARLLQPIRSDAPSGTDLRYDPRVEALKEARREDLDIPTNNAEVKRKLADWPAVVAAATKLLAEETKDVQLSVWLTEALMHKEGYAGLATGLTVLQGLLQEFWDTIYPIPEDEEDEARLGPLVWIGAKLVIPVRMVSFGPTSVSFFQIEASREVPTEAEAEKDAAKRGNREAAIEQGKTSPETIDSALASLNKAGMRTLVADLDAAKGALAALEKTTDEKFPIEPPSFSGLRTALDEIRRYASLVLAKRLEQDPDPAVDPDAPPTDAGAGTTDDGAGLSVEPANRVDASQRLAVVARWFRAQEPTNPSSYLALRGFRWGELHAAAPDIDPKLLEAPPTATRARLKTLLLDSKWTELLEQGETVMVTAAGRGWLDLQRYVLTACNELGGGYDSVAVAIRSELRALLLALPELTRMTLMDDTPTANDETRVWLARHILLNGKESPDSPSEPDAGAPDSAADGNGAGILGDALEEDASSAHQGGFSRTRLPRRALSRTRDPFDIACGELALGRPNRAIEVLVSELAREHSPRGRLVRQTQIAYVMVEAGFDTVAQPILQRVIETIDERNLEQWESGPLVAQPMALLCRVLDRTGGDESVRAELYLRVCRLDPLQALALQTP